jgi:RNA polymerase sigma-70 factor (ECF subfamily)
MAAILAVPVGTIRSRLNAARKKLNELFAKGFDADEALLQEAREWSDFYTTTWSQMHNDLQLRSRFFDHMLPQVKIRFTNGKSENGRYILERELDQDLVYGTTIAVQDVISSGSISIVEFDNINSKDFPDRCPPSTTFVAFRNENRIHTAHVFETSRA